MSGRRFSEIRGGLIKPVVWQFNVVHLPQNNKYKGLVIVNQIAWMGNDGEITIGTPMDFNNFPEVIDALRDPKRLS
jgi:hypothetical protein